MITVRLKGGMGNQMFQYAFGRRLAKELGEDLQLDLTSLLDRSKGDFVYRDYDLPIFHVRDQFVHTPALLRTLYRPKKRFVYKWLDKAVKRGRTHIKEEHFHFEPTFVNEPVRGALYEGWFQSYRYFEGVEEELRNDFRFIHPILPESAALLARIKACNAVCLNVRRTDFLKVDNLNTTNLDYFLGGAQRIADLTDRPHFFIFSDDVAWCREHIKLDHPTEVVGHEHKGIKFGNYLQLMIACQHYIIPNSSFAWWATWLNENPAKLVVAPKNWFADQNIDTSDLVPADWIRL